MMGIGLLGMRDICLAVLERRVEEYGRMIRDPGHPYLVYLRGLLAKYREGVGGV
jgi:hypothetical protein